LTLVLIAAPHDKTAAPSMPDELDAERAGFSERTEGPASTIAAPRATIAPQEPSQTLR
jgi:hypothetical protein